MVLSKAAVRSPEAFHLLPYCALKKIDRLLVEAAPLPVSHFFDSLFEGVGKAFQCD